MSIFGVFNQIDCMPACFPFDKHLSCH